MFFWEKKLPYDNDMSQAIISTPSEQWPALLSLLNVSLSLRVNCVALIPRLFAFASAASAERRRLLACSPRGKGHRRRRPARSWTLEPGCHLPRATARTRCKKTSLSRSLVLERAMLLAAAGGSLHLLDSCGVRGLIWHRLVSSKFGARAVVFFDQI